MEPINKAKMYELLNQFAESLPDDGEAEGDGMPTEGMDGPPGEVEISVETKPEGMGKQCPTCGHAME